MSLATSCSFSFSASSSSIAALTSSLSYSSFIAGIHGQDLEWDESSFLNIAGVDDSYLFDRPAVDDFEGDSLDEVLDTSDVVVFQGSGYVSQSDIPLANEVLPPKKIGFHSRARGVSDVRRRLFWEIQRQEEEHRRQIDGIRQELRLKDKDSKDEGDDEDDQEEVSTVDMLKVLEEKARRNGIPWGYF